VKKYLGSSLQTNQLWDPTIEQRRLCWVLAGHILPLGK
jgi:hypothetical protein